MKAGRKEDGGLFEVWQFGNSKNNGLKLEVII